MPVIKLETHINAPIQVCFDLSTSIDLHKISTAATNEKAIAGTTEGLINLNEQVTWEATHFGIRQQLTTKITAFDSPVYFRDEQLKGAFKFLEHDHYFEQNGDAVVMKDVFNFQSPFGFVGHLFDRLILTNYMRKFLIERNNVIKEFAETDQWKLVLIQQQ
jgi:ligand-binding SRPBCC domain-containing protein